MDNQEFPNHAPWYRERAEAIRTLLPGVRYPETRANLERLAAEYERLARFADTRHRVSQADEWHAMRVASAKRRAAVKSLLEECDDAFAGALRIRGEFIRTELELGFTFLEGAMKTRESKIVQRCIRNAIAALRSANRFLALEPRLNDSGINDRRNELQERLQSLLVEQSPKSTSR